MDAITVEEMDEHLESLLMRLEREQEELLDKEAERDLWMKRCWKAGATSRQLAYYSGLSPTAALKKAQKRPTRVIAMPEATRAGEITRELIVEDH